MTEASLRNYQQVTQSQFDIWKDSDVTKAYLESLEYRISELVKLMGEGSCVVADNADLTLSNSHNVLGQQAGLEFACNLDLIIERYDLIKKESTNE